MLKANRTYYSYNSVRDGSLLAVFRVHDDESKLPERYAVGFGWVDCQAVFYQLATGDLGPGDVIGEEEALALIRELKNGHFPWRWAAALKSLLRIQ